MELSSTSLLNLNLDVSLAMSFVQKNISLTSKQHHFSGTPERMDLKETKDMKRKIAPVHLAV